MTNDCLAKTLKDIQDKNRSSFKQAEMLDALILSKLIGRHFFTISRFRLNGASWREIAEALSTCTEQSITRSILENVFGGYVLSTIMLLVTGIYAYFGSLTGIIPFEFLFPAIPIIIGAVHIAEVLSEVVTKCDHLTSLKFSPTLPFVFTEHGALMLGNVLKSPRAIEVSLLIVRAFVQLREMLSSHKELALKLEELERKVGFHDKTIASLNDTAAALSACTGTSITGKMLEQAISVYVTIPFAIIGYIPLVSLAIAIGQSFFAVILVTAPLMPIILLIFTCAGNILEEMR